MASKLPGAPYPGKSETDFPISQPPLRCCAILISIVEFSASVDYRLCKVRSYAVDEGQQTKRRKMKKRSWRQAVRNPPIRMGQNWEPVLTEDKLKVALAKKEEARLTAGELENRLKELRTRLKS
jgi:hypothetical protein